MIFEIADFPSDINKPKHDILGKHILNIGIDLTYGIYIHMTRLSHQFCKDAIHKT